MRHEPERAGDTEHDDREPAELETFEDEDLNDCNDWEFLP